MLPSCHGMYRSGIPCMRNGEQTIYVATPHIVHFSSNIVHTFQITCHINNVNTVNAGSVCNTGQYIFLILNVTIFSSSP